MFWCCQSGPMPVVMTPWELREHVGFLLRESVPHASLAGIQRSLGMFLRSWQACWACHGDDPSGWTPPIVSTSVNDPASIEALAAAIDSHQAWLADRPGAAGRLETRRAQHVGSLLARRVGEVLDDLPPEVLRQPLAAIYETVARRLVESREDSPQST